MGFPRRPIVLYTIYVRFDSVERRAFVSKKSENVIKSDKCLQFLAVAFVQGFA